MLTTSAGRAKETKILFFLTSMTLVYCGSLASVHRHKPASPSDVSASCCTSLHCSFSGSSLQAPSCERVPTLDCSCRRDLVFVDRSCHQATDRTRSSARTHRFLSSGVSKHEKAQHDLSPGSVLAARVASQALLRIRGPRYPFNFVVDFAVGVYTCMTNALLITPFGLSRGYRALRAGHIVARRFRVCRQPLRIEASIVRSRDTKTTASSARSYRRDGGKFLRFGCAGALRSRGFGCLRSAGSVLCSDRISEFRELVRTELCAIPLAVAGGAFCQDLDISQILAVCFLSRFLPSSKANLGLLRRFQESSSDSRQTGGCRTLSR